MLVCFGIDIHIFDFILVMLCIKMCLLFLVPSNLNATKEVKKHAKHKMKHKHKHHKHKVCLNFYPIIPKVKLLLLNISLSI